MTYGGRFNVAELCVGDARTYTRTHPRVRARSACELGHVSDLAQSRRPTPSREREREREGVAAHNAFSGRRRQRREKPRRKKRKKKRARRKEKNASRRKATDGIRVSRAVRGSQYP